MQEYTISNKTRRNIQKIFDNNHRIEVELYRAEKTSRDLEKEYLEELRMNPSLPMPQGLIYRTMTGIEEQLKNALSDSRTFVFCIILCENLHSFSIEKFPIEGTNFFIENFPIEGPNFSYFS
jgi:hypothetical protein